MLASSIEYTLRNCCWIDLGNMCKHVINVFKMKYGWMEDRTIIKFVGTLKGIATNGLDTSKIDGIKDYTKLHDY